MMCTRITIDPKRLSVTPCIRGLRISVATVVDLMQNGITAEEILDAYSHLEWEVIRAVL